MTDKQLACVKIICLAAAVAVIAVTGKSFYDHRHFPESVVGTHVTEVKMLSDYFPPIKGTFADTAVFVIDSGKPGGSMLVLGGSHPEEPSGVLSAQVLAENASLEAGRLFVCIHTSNSGSRSTRPGEGYPQYYSIPTAWGEKVFRMGDRFYNPLDSWPDPEVYVHYPSGQMLASSDIRNHNRTWPGRPDGMPSEQSTYAFMEMIRKEKIDFVIDLHEAELEYPVINTVVSHERGVDMAAIVSMTLTAEEFDVPLGMEYSPPGLHGLTHREIGDASDSFGFILETAEPMLDRVRGETGTELLLTGKDPFVVIAGQHGLLYSPIDENGWPIDKRVGRHLSSILSLAEAWTDMNADKPLIITGVPRYAEVLEKGTGNYFHNPADARPDKVFQD